jgi:hypothetical protein
MVAPAQAADAAAAMPPTELRQRTQQKTIQNVNKLEIHWRQKSAWCPHRLATSLISALRATSLTGSGRVGSQSW